MVDHNTEDTVERGVSPVGVSWEPGSVEDNTSSLGRREKYKEGSRVGSMVRNMAQDNTSRYNYEQKNDYITKEN